MTSSDACILAVDVLDQIVSDLVKDNTLSTAPEFLDWIADEVTPLIEVSVETSFDNPRFVTTLSMGRPDIAMSQWVRHWIGPTVESKYQQFRQEAPKRRPKKTSKSWVRRIKMRLAN